MQGLPPVVSLQVLDTEALAAAIRNANFQPCQLSVRPSPSKIARVMCENVCLDFATLGPAMLFSGSMPKDCYSLIFVTECPQKGRSFNFAVEHNDGYMGFFPPGVELMFHDSLGIGPSAFIRHLRLHGVRRALRTAPPVAGVVKESALKWGFWHMGHFSREYRSLFGESPSVTLASRP